MSLVVTSLLVAGGLIAGRWIVKVIQRKSSSEDARGESLLEPDAASPVPSEEPKMTKDAARAHPRDPFEGFPCKLGDVVIRAGGSEAWLAGALVFSEDAVVAAMFVAPDAGADRAVFVRAGVSDSITWMDPLEPDAVAVAHEPPTSIEHAGMRFERARRLPVRVERAGTGAPDIGDRAILAEYTAPGGERLVLVVGAPPARAWRGVALEPGMFDVLAAGQRTLE